MNKPDIVFIHCHDLGRRLSIYGETSLPTPGLERLADEGIVFDRFYSTSHLCSPSRGSILTGRYPHQIGLFGLTNNRFDLDDGETGIPHYLNRQGYHTLLVGMHHDARDDAKLGYQEIIPLPSPHPAPAWEVAAQAVEYIQNLAPKEEREPLYLNLGLFEPHRHNFYDRYTSADPDETIVPGYLPDTPGVREDLASYDGLIKAMDEGVKTVLEALDKKGIADETLVLFTTDHGIAFPCAKVTLYDAGIGVAALARWPGRIAAGSRADALLSHVDWLPTLIELTGGDKPERVEGTSFLPLMLGGRYEQKDAVFAEATFYDVEKFNPVRCIRTEKFKLICNYDSDMHHYENREANPNNGIRALEDYDESYWEKRPPFELYDLEADPLEQNNLAGNEEYADILNHLKKRLAAHLESTGDPVYQIYKTHSEFAL